MRIETTRTTLAARLFQRDMARDSKWAGRRIAASASVTDAARPLWMRATALIMVAVTYFAPAVFLADEVAHAAPIVDPRAPIAFQPSVTQTSTGVPAINIPAANGNGISVGQYQSFDVDSRGLVLNNSTVAGTPLLGGTLGANPNLNGRPASTIINQVTSNNIAVLNGPLEVFGASATVIVAAPGGVSVNGMSLTNIPGLTLTTGTPQFLTGVGGAATDFGHAGAVAYDVRSGAIAISGPAGVNGPGAGIEGTVGNIDLIGQSVSINAPLRADQRVNVVTGNQIVTPMATDATGTTYGTSSNGTTNTASAIGKTVAVDANQYGSVTSGTVYIVSTAAGIGVNTQGSLSATAGNVVVNSNGDVVVGQTFANQNVNLTSAGNTTISGMGLANQNYTVNANGDINAPGSVSAGQNVSMTAGGNLNAASVAANGAASLTAGQSMTIGTLSAHDIALQTTNGDLTVGGLSAPGTVSAKAGRDLTVNGAVQGGSTMALAGARNAAVNGAVTSVGDTSLTATTGTAVVNGNLQSNGAATVTAGQNATIGGTTQAQGPVSITAQAGWITGQGNVTSSQGAISLNAGQAIALNGAVQSGTTITAKAGTHASFGGTVTAPGAVTIQAMQNTTLGGDVTSGGNLSVTSGGSTQVNGTVASIGDMTLAANGGTLRTTGNVVSLGALNATGQQGVNLGGTVHSGGNALIGSSAGSVAVGGAVSTPGALNINAAQDATVADTVQTGQSATISAGRDANLNGGLSVNGTGNATVTAGRDINGTGAISVANDTTLNAGNNIAISGAIQTGNNLSATSANNLSVGAATAVNNSTLAAAHGSATLTGNALSGGAMTITAGTDATAQGSVTSLGDLNVNAKAGNLTASGPVSAVGNATLNAGQNLAMNGPTTVSKDAVLTAANITTQGLAVGGNLTATATNNLDTSAGQLNAAFDANAPALSVNGNATLSGAKITTANAVVGGTTRITGSQSVTTGGTAAFKGDATLAGGAINNVGTQMVAGNLNVLGTTITNAGALSSLKTATISASSLNNSGTIYGPTANINVANATTNSGSVLATNALNLTTNSLANSGLIFAGDVNNPSAATGNTTVTVTGGNGSFENSAGKILAQNIATLNLPNQALDPSSAIYGTVNGGYGLNLSALSVNNSGTWTLPGTAVNVSAAQGITNSGVINQGTGSLTLNGAVNNSGVVNGNDLTINGSLANQANGTIATRDAFTLNGSGTNAGVVQANNALTISGTTYDNSGGTTRAGNSNNPAGSGNASINLSGDLGNAGGTLTATNDLSIKANNVNNSTATSSNTATTTTTIVNSPLLMSTGIGTEYFHYIEASGLEGELVVATHPLPATLGGILSPAGDSLKVQAVNIAGQPYILDLTKLTSTGDDNHISTAPNANTPVATSGQVQYVRVPYASSGGTGSQYIWVIQDGTVPTSDGNGPYQVMTLNVPTVTETRTSVSATNSASVIAAGHNVNLTANSLDNQGGTLSAGNDANINLQSLNNRGATYTAGVTDSVDSASLIAFMTGLQTMQQSGTVSIRGSGNTSGAYCGSGGCVVGPANPPISYQFTAPNAVTVQSVRSSTTIQTPAGQILAGHDVNLTGGNLTNAGSIAAGNDVNVSAASFTNQGTNNGAKTVTAGCAPGFNGCATQTTNPNSETYSYTQTNSTVTAGHDIVIASNQVANIYGSLVAKNNVVIGGAGTTAAASTQATSVTNTSGAIEAGHDVNINAATLTNMIAAPAQVHQNYGNATPFTGCTSNCEAYVDVQSANPATITANHDVNVTAGTFSNTGSLVTALNNVTINAQNSASSNNQYLDAYWASNLTHYGASYPAWGCANNPALCQQLYGSAYSTGNAQDPAGLPSSVGMPDFVPGTIQAGNTLKVNSPTLTNTGNVIGQSVALTGATLVNGITNPNVYTPPPAVSGQVISLGPVAVPSNVATTVNSAGFVTNLNGQRTSVTGAAGLPPNSPVGVQTVGKPTTPSVTVVSTPQITTVKTTSGETVSATYLTNNPAAQIVDSISSASLIAALPSNLRPGSVPFYYDPYTESQQIEQAALQATGRSSFYSTPSATDSTSQASIAAQDKAALYGAALEYAKQNNIALGTQLSHAQLALIDAPMLWYVEQTVPEPGCTATGNGVCPTVQALMPEILLPQNYAVVNADGEITGTNVALNYANSILNTGNVTAQNLTVNTNSLTNEQRSTNIGTIYQNVSGGVAVTTGTVVQQGGFMSAANHQLNVDALNQIGGALQKVTLDGTVDAAGTQAMLANLKSQLGGNFQQSTVADHLSTTLISDNSFGIADVFAMAVIATISTITGGLASAAVGAGATAGSAFAAATPATTTTAAVGAGVGNVMISAAVTGMMNSTMSQLANGGHLSLTGVLEGGAVGAVTAGLTNGITVNNGSVGWSWGYSPNSLAALAGVQSVGNALVPQAGAATGSLSTAIGAIAAESALQAGVLTAIEGGSFLTNLRNSAVNNVAAAVSYAIGNANVSGDFGSGLTGELSYVAAHSALGCAAGAATGQGCGGGAIGAAASAALSADFIKAIDPTGAPLNQGQLAALAAFATIAGGGLAGLAGENAVAGATAAQNEALNNDAGDPTHTAHAAKNGGFLNALPLPAKLVYLGASALQTNLTWPLANAILHTGAPQNTQDPNQLDQSSNGPHTGGPSAPALVTVVSALACALSGGEFCGLMGLPLASAGGSGGPSNTLLSSGNSDSGSGGGTSGQGATKSAATGTVWDSITATQPNYPGSVIPKSFEMSLPNGQSVWVHGNATEHMAEYAQMVANNNSPGVVQLATQQQLSSLRSAVNTATQGGVPYNQLINVGGWELKFAPPRLPGQLPALIHALPTGK
ncbi:filamentous hemagglutinin N-terminal domain-containing protein [Burkholderia ubonensis]|uniref:two-partner secretion domain-containing protein n=2 Tax=Burkholderia ubonensis TaxID=101571 RepID=UPI00075DAE9A|nr:filamentous hemagglutinin N-terminal domain-containing protein [Burkholderia ubonensis]KWC65233.1 filamentous hemagglutinin [Burkholderia ubonensis]